MKQPRSILEHVYSPLLLAIQIEKTHPADWRNPGRVKVLIKKDNQYAHPIIQTRKYNR
jgi:uncharacterized protein (UPF0305 family)